MKKFIIFIIILAVIFGISMPFLIETFSISDSNGKNVEFSVKSGESISSIAKNLKTANIIKYESSFKTKIKLDNLSTKIHYGTFTLNTGMSVSTIIKTITGNGKNNDGFTLVVPEGYSVEQIANKLSDLGICSNEDFFNALNDEYNYTFVKNIPKKDYKLKLQGFLFPQTYEFFKDATPHQIIDTMLNEFLKQYSKIGDENSINYDTIILASLIEREAKLDNERGKIAGVITNRLEKNMPLQVDASVVYIISDGLYNVDTVYYKDLENKSLYNTYKYKGLPVAPICNPGIKSIKAAMIPTKHDYLYYHTDEEKKDGSHIFTKTYDEHVKTQ